VASGLRSGPLTVPPRLVRCALRVPCVPASFSCILPAITPRDAILLSDKRVPTIGIFCALCQRRETFDVESLKLQHGGAERHRSAEPPCGLWPPRSRGTPTLPHHSVRKAIALRLSPWVRALVFEWDR
jgi:hypothetical protein